MPVLPTKGKESGLWLPTPDTGLTPNGHGARGGKPGNGRQSGASLTAMAKHNAWPTPTASMMTMADVEQARYAGNKGGNRPSYGEAKAMWATPTASVGGPEPEGKTGRKLVTQVGGSLNPTWVEWLMAWPLGWTDLKPSETAKFPFVQPQPGEC